MVTIDSKYMCLFFSLCAVVLCLRVGYAGVYTDEVGRRVDIPAPPERIVSLAPNITETLFALGLDEKIVGVTMFSDYPEGARLKPRIGSYINLSLEKIVALSPDLIIGTADGNEKAVVVQLESVGLPVYVINPKSFDDIFDMILDIGMITGKKTAAEKLVDILRKRVRTVVSLTRDLKKPRVFYQIGIDPIVTVGRDTLHDHLITMAGGYNLTGEIPIPYPRLSIEKIIGEQPDIIIVSSMKRGGDFTKIRDEWKNWNNIPAVKNGRLHIINSDLTDHSSPRIVDGLESLARIIHPEVSWDF